MSQKSTAICKVGTGTLVTGPCVVKNLGLLAGADAATATFRDGGSLGPIRWVLGAGIGLSAGVSFEEGARFTTDVHVTITGTTPTVCVAIDNPPANQ